MSESAQNRYFRKQLEKRLGKSIIGIGQVVSEEFEVAQRQQGKFTSYKEQASGVLLNKYKVRICSATNDTDRVDDLIDAYGQSPTSGLRGEVCPTPSYPVNTYVTIFQDPLTELYYIEHAHLNTKVDLPKTKEFAGCGAASGFVPGSINFKVPQSCIDQEGKGVASGSEVPRNSVPSDADKKQNTHNESIEIPSPCIPVDTAAINKELEGLIKFVEELKGGVLGEDSFLQTSQEFLGKVQSKISEVSEAIANSIAWLINKIREYVMRKVNGIVNNTIGNLYLNARFAALEASDEALNLISCLFLKILSNLANFISDFLKELIDKFLNTGLCVVESFLSSLLGSILPSILNAINSILGPLSNLIGTAISLANDVIAFAESIIDFLSCDVEQLCPVTNEWNFLEGGIDSSSFSLSTLDFNSVFESAKAFGDSFIALGDVPGDVADSLSGINAQKTIQDALDAAEGCGGSNLVQCGVPTVSFWGADGSGTTGNAVVNTLGEVIGVNIITPGSGYTTPPTISINDACGKGTGAYATAVLGPVRVFTNGRTTGDGTIVPGFGDLPRLSPQVVGVSTAVAGISTLVTGVSTIDVGTTSTTGGTTSTTGGTTSVTGGTTTGGTTSVTGGTTTGGTTSTTGGTTSVTGGTTSTTGGTTSTTGGTTSTTGGTTSTTGGATSGGRESAVVIGVVAVIMNNTGYGYLPSADGSVGGMNRTIADRCQSLIRRGDTKKWEGPFDSGEVIDIRVGDTVRLAGVPEYISEENTSITAPPCPDLVSSSLLSSTYSVVSSIGNIFIEDPGFGFSEGDTITVIPDNGAELVPVIGGNGRIIDVNIINPGIGFTSVPTLKLNTNTGYNATLIPILSFKRVGEDDAFSVPDGTQLIQVVDCVGKN